MYDLMTCTNVASWCRYMYNAKKITLISQLNITYKLFKTAAWFQLRIRTWTNSTMTFPHIQVNLHVYVYVIAPTCLKRNLLNSNAIIKVWLYICLYASRPPKKSKLKCTASLTISSVLYRSKLTTIHFIAIIPTVILEVADLHCVCEAPPIGAVELTRRGGGGGSTRPLVEIDVI